MCRMSAQKKLFFCLFKKSQLLFQNIFSVPSNGKIKSKKLICNFLSSSSSTSSFSSVSFTSSSSAASPPCAFLSACKNTSNNLNAQNSARNLNSLNNLGTNELNNKGTLLHKVAAIAMSIREDQKRCSSAPLSPWSCLRGYRVNLRSSVGRSFGFYENCDNQNRPFISVEVEILKTPQDFSSEFEKQNAFFLDELNKKEGGKKLTEKVYVLKLNVKKISSDKNKNINKSEAKQEQKKVEEKKKENEEKVTYEDEEVNQIYHAQIDGGGKIKIRNSSEKNSSFQSFSLSKKNAQLNDFVCIEGISEEGICMGEAFYLEPQIYGGEKWKVEFDFLPEFLTKNNFQNATINTHDQTLVPPRPGKVVLGYIYGADPLGGAANLKNVTATMNAKVLKIDVEIGQHVTPGESLVVLEAMKMETVLRSPCEGHIESISVSNGQSVNVNQTILSIAQTAN